MPATNEKRKEGGREKEEGERKPIFPSCFPVSISKVEVLLGGKKKKRENLLIFPFELPATRKRRKGGGKRRKREGDSSICIHFLSQIPVKKGREEEKAVAMTISKQHHRQL